MSAFVTASDILFVWFIGLSLSSEENREHWKYFWNVYNDCVLTNHMRDLVTTENKWVSQSRNRVGSPFDLKDLHLNSQEYLNCYFFLSESHMHYGSEKFWVVFGLLRLHCSNDRGLSKAAFIILQQPGVPLLNLKICHFQNVQLHVIWYKPGSKARMIRP